MSCYTLIPIVNISIHNMAERKLYEFILFAMIASIFFVPLLLPATEKTQSPEKPSYSNTFIYTSYQSPSCSNSCSDISCFNEINYLNKTFPILLLLVFCLSTLQNHHYTQKYLERIYKPPK